jgi:hypothetical protein
MTATDLFKIVSIFKNMYRVENLYAVCTDGAPAMLGYKSGFRALIKNVTQFQMAYTV